MMAIAKRREVTQRVIPTLGKVLHMMDIHPLTAAASHAVLIEVGALSFIANEHAVFDASGDISLQWPTYIPQGT